MAAACPASAGRRERGRDRHHDGRRLGTGSGLPTINIGRTGGNTFRSHAFFSGLRGGMQSSNTRMN
jgi:hypothetical protein